MEKTYSIGDKSYIQRPIVLGQFRALVPILSGIQFDGNDIETLVCALGDRLPKALAVVLIDSGTDIREAMQHIDERTEDLLWSLDTETSMGVVEDFFECNPVSSVLQKVTETMTQMAHRIRKNQILSSESSSSSPEAISGDETTSFGEQAQESPSSGSSSEPNSEPTSSTGS